jgi:catechol 2,3-dioxygenase-like lactoylglutathione lyase family enzyme
MSRTHQVGRLLDHVHINVSDLATSARFYQAVLKALELPPARQSAHALQGDELYVSEPQAGQQLSHVHIAFQARDRQMVQAFYDAALAAGGRDNGGPGERSYHPGYYSAFVLDPDGNNIEAVTHGPATRSAASIEITPQ